MSRWTDSSQESEVRSSSTDAALYFKTKNGFRVSLADAALYFKTECGYMGLSFSKQKVEHINILKEVSNGATIQESIYLNGRSVHRETTGIRASQYRRKGLRGSREPVQAKGIES